MPPSESAGSRIGSARIDLATARASASSASRSAPRPSASRATARAACGRGIVDAQHGELQVGQRMARAQHVERAFDLLLARVDQGDETLAGARP